jgi:hypothetical protein
MKTRIVPSSELSPETLRAQDYVSKELNAPEEARRFAGKLLSQRWSVYLEERAKVLSCTQIGELQEAFNQLMVMLSEEPSKLKEHARKALELIAEGDNLCYDVALFHGQDFENVKHMTWFKYAVMSRMCGAD